MKLVLQEPGAAALAGALVEWAGRVSSALLAVEAVRAAARYGDRFAQAARDGLQDVSLMPVDLSLLEAAAVLAAPSLRSLDAVHLATALRLGRELGPVFCYDERLAAAARGAGLDVRAPA